MKVYIVYWGSPKEEVEFSRVYASEELAEECANYISSLRPKLSAYYMEVEVETKFTEYDKEYFDWRSTL